MGKQFVMKKLASSLLLATLASVGAAASAQSIVTGGATLPEPLYNDEIDTFNSPSISSRYFDYVGTGSGTGKTAFIDNTASLFGRTGDVHWVGSDSLLSDAQLDGYVGTGGQGEFGNPAADGPLIQIPSVATPVTVSYRTGTPTALTLTSDQLCGIFSGRFNNWSDLGLPAATIKVAYRTDGSGTTELFTTHLAAVCNTGNSDVPFFGTDEFAEVFAADGVPIPANFVGRAGSGGVVAEAEASDPLFDTAFTYVSPDPDYTGDLQQASLVNPNNSVAYAPTIANVQLAVTGLVAPNGPLVKDPTLAAYAATTNPANPKNWVRNIPNPGAGYPIVGTTNLVVSQCYSTAAETTAVRDFLTQHYAPAAQIEDHLLSPLPPVLRGQVVANFLTGNARALEVGNATVCGDVAGR